VVLNALSSASQVVTFHGPVLVWNLGSESGIDDYTEDHMSRALRTAPLRVAPEPSWQWLKPGKASGRAWGGNLWSFQQLVGTPFLPSMKGAVLFVEECFAELHNIQAGLVHLRTAGLLEDLSALIVGVPLECNETEMPDNRTFEDIVVWVCEGLDFPILAGVNLGHTDKKITIPIGATAHLDSNRNQLIFEM
jgi:muramoyltetrapeptide carboxypeptidase LdcA involved in peptidoglycan recycling